MLDKSCSSARIQTLIGAEPCNVLNTQLIHSHWSARLLSHLCVSSVCPWTRSSRSAYCWLEAFSSILISSISDCNWLMLGHAGQKLHFNLNKTCMKIPAEVFILGWWKILHQIVDNKGVFVIFFVSFYTTEIKGNALIPLLLCWGSSSSSWSSSSVLSLNSSRTCCSKLNTEAGVWSWAFSSWKPPNIYFQHPFQQIVLLKLFCRQIERIFSNGVIQNSREYNSNVKSNGCIYIRNSNRS